MKRQSLVLLAVAFVAAGAAGCFKDPVSSLRNGPSVLSVDASNIVVRTGDSTVVTATLLDNAGNVLAATGATWTSLNPAIAVVRMDTTQAIPGNAYTKGFIRGVDSVSGGWTNVIVTARGIADTIRVVVIPSKLTVSRVAVAGTAEADTVINPKLLLPPTPVTYTAYSAGDTLVLTGTNLLTFDTSKVTVNVNTNNGNSKGLIVAKSPSQVKVVFETGAVGKVMVQHMLLAPGNATVGTIKVDTLISDPVSVGAWHASGALFGGSTVLAGDTLTITAGTNIAFSAATTVDLTDATDSLLTATPLYIMSQTATTIRALASASAAKQRVTLRNVTMAADASVGNITFDSLKTNDVAYAMVRASLPASYVVQAGDTLTITAVSPVVFDTSTAASDTLADGTPARSQVTFDTGSAPNVAPAANAIILVRTPTTMSYVLSPVANTGPVAVTNAFVGLARVPALITTGSYTINPFALPAANVALGGGKLGDTVTITAPAGMPFTTSGNVSNVILGNTAIATSDTAWVLSRTATTIKAFAKRGGKGRVTVTNLNLGALVVPSLATLASSTIDSVASDLPVSQSEAGALALTIPANDTAVVYGTALPGALNGGFAQSYWTFTTSATQTIFGNVAWFGSGNPYSTGTNTTKYTEDLDMLICNAVTACDESSADLSVFQAATAVQPQFFTVAALPAAQYWINVAGFNVKYSIIYQLTVVLK